MNKAIATGCILSPIVLFLIPFFSHINFVWNVADTSWQIDLLISCLYFAPFLGGFVMLQRNNHNRGAVIICLVLLFEMYQLVRIGLRQDPLARYRLNDTTEVILWSRDGGAFTNTNRVFLDLQETTDGIFVKKRAIKSWRNVLFDNMDLRGGNIQIRFRRFSGGEFTDQIPISGSPASL